MVVAVAAGYCVGAALDCGGRWIGGQAILPSAVGAGFAMEALELFITQPLARSAYFIKPPDLSSLMELFGNWKMPAARAGADVDAGGIRRGDVLSRLPDESRR